MEMRGDATNANVNKEKGEGSAGVPADETGNNSTLAAQAPTADANNGNLHKLSKE